MRARDVMQPVVDRITEDATFLQAAAQLHASGWSELPVTTQDRFVGVLAEGDVLRALIPDIDELARLGASLAATFDAFLDRGDRLAGERVSRVVIRDPIVVAPDDELLRVATVMVSHQIRRLFVVDGAELAGTITRADICLGALQSRRDAQPSHTSASAE